MKLAMILVSIFCLSISSFCQENKTETESIKENQRVQEALFGFLEVGKKALQDGVQMVKDGADISGQFARKEIPVILSEVIAIRRATVIFYLLGLIVFVLIANKYTNDFRKYAYSDQAKEDLSYTDRDTVKFFSVFLRVIMFVIAILIFYLNIRGWILPWISPRVYLLEYAFELFKTAK